MKFKWEISDKWFIINLIYLCSSFLSITKPREVKEKKNIDDAQWEYLKELEGIEFLEERAREMWSLELEVNIFSPLSSKLPISVICLEGYS